MGSTQGNKEVIPLNEDFGYGLVEEAAIEDFEEGSLIFLCNQRIMIEINPIARSILELMNEKKGLKQIIKLISEDFKLDEITVRGDVHRLVNDLSVRGAIKPFAKIFIDKKGQAHKLRNIIANPDVSILEESDGKATLSDKESLLIINPVGLSIWKFIMVLPRTRHDILNHIKEICENVPEDLAESDINDFLEELQRIGFIGEAISSK